MSKNKDKKVYVISGDYLLTRMFTETEGYECTNTLSEADVIVFPGGADINPSLYGEKKIPGTSCNQRDDERDLDYWNRKDKKEGVLHVGVCRGAQFTNVMSGGKLYQDVNNHGRIHKAVDLLITKTELSVTSTHHQMMIPGPKGVVLCIAKEATVWRNAEYPDGVIDKPEYDTEVVFYPETNTLCFQSHPEYNQSETKNYFFDLLDHFLKGN